MSSTDGQSDDQPVDAAPAGSAPHASDQWVTRATLVLVSAFVLIGIGLPLLGIGAFAGSDLMMTRAPWNSLVPTGFAPQNPYVGDTVDGLIPSAHAFAERLWAGDFASWWSENTGGGQLGTGGSGALLSPLSVPYLILPTSMAPAYVKLLEMLVMIGGMYLFLRKIALAKAAALLGGIVFASSGFVVAWTSWPHTKVAAFIPALFWAVERIARSRRLADVALIAVIVGCMLLGGFPAVTAYALLVAGLYLIVRLATLEGWRPARLAVTIGLAAAGLLLGLALAAVYIAPFVQELREVAVGPRTQSGQNHSPMISMVTMLAPDALGGTNPRTADVGWYGLGHPIEEISYVGAAVLLLVVVAIVARRRPGVPSFVRGFFVVAAATTVVLVFFGGPLLEAAQQLPVFSTNRIGRARSILGFVLAVLAAIGFDATIRRSAAIRLSTWRHRAWVALATLTWLTAAVAALLVVREARRYAFGRGRAAAFDDSLMVAAAFGVLALLAVVLARRGGWVRPAALTVVPLLVVVQALLLVVPFWPRVPESQFYPSTPTHDFLQTHVGSDRFVAAGTMQTGTDSYYGLRTVQGRGFVAKEYDRLLRGWCNSCFLTATYVAVPANPDLFDDPLLDRLGARYLVTDPAEEVVGEPEVVGGRSDVVALEPDQPVSVPLPAGQFRAVGVDVAEPFVPVDPWASIDVEIKDSAGTTLVATTRRLLKGAQVGPYVIAVPEDDVGAATTLVVTLNADLPMAVRADGDAPALALVRPADDGLKVVHGGDTTIYERTTALPRIRWAQTMGVEPDRDRAIALVNSGEAPDVVLSDPAPAPDDAPADLVIVEDSGDTVTVDLDAEGLGYLVVADGLQDRWTATLDGAPVPLLDADYGYVAVEVPPGAHTVQLEFDRDWAVVGYLVSGVAVVAVVLLLMLDRRSRRRRASAVPTSRHAMQPGAP